MDKFIKLFIFKFASNLSNPTDIVVLLSNLSHKSSEILYIKLIEIRYDGILILKIN